MRRPRVLFDVDGIFTDGFTQECCRRIRERTGIDAQPHLVTQWDIMACFNVPKDAAKAIYKSMEEPGVAMAFEPAPGAQELVADVEKWADVYMVTSPMGGRHWLHDREDWLFKVFGTPKRRVAPIHDKFIVFGDAIVEDKHENLVIWHGAHPHGYAIQFEKTYNKHQPWTPTVASFDELRDALEVVRKRFY